MKTYLKKIIRKGLSKLVGTEDLPELLARMKQLTEAFDPPNARRLFNDMAATNQAVQRLLKHSYHQLQSEHKLPHELAETAFRCFSQTDEDGLLWYIFSLIGTTNKRVVEICAGDGIECNASNLIVNHGWTGLLFDGSEENIATGKRFYSRCRDTFSLPPAFVHAWITAENINDLVSGHGFQGEIDLLSLDVDGMDFWIWKALTCIRPRVVILEFVSLWGPEKAVTLPYQPAFRLDWERLPLCCGASLGAYTKLARERGYRLVGTNRAGFNAIFVRDDAAKDLLPEVTPAECFQKTPHLRHWSPTWLPDRTQRPEWWDVVEV